MADSSLETQIDCFLEQFKRSASKAMDDHSYEPSSPDEPLQSCEEIEMQTSITVEPLGVSDVADLLEHQYAVITGGKSREGCPIITFPDNNNFQNISDILYQRLMMYLTSVPSLQEADMGFHLVVDRRKDKWNSVKSVLTKISVYFPGLVHVVYVLKPTSFIQKALSEMSNKLFKDEFKFKVIELNTAEELHEYICPRQLTEDLGGSLNFKLEDWIQQRLDLERFSLITHEVSNSLAEFTKTIDETGLPNTVESTQHLLEYHSKEYSKLKDEILGAARHGETLLYSIKEKQQSEDVLGNVFDVERLLVQLEETEKTFDEFWQKYSIKLRNCLDLRRFEQDFRELQANFDSHLRVLNEMNEVGDNISRVETLIKELSVFEKLCFVDIERSEEVIASGQHLIASKSYPVECVEPKCKELVSMKEILIDKLSKRLDALINYKRLMEKIDKVNAWCDFGMELTNRKIDKYITVDAAQTYLKEIEEFIGSAKNFTQDDADEFRNLVKDISSVGANQTLCSVFKRMEEVSMKCQIRRVELMNIAKASPAEAAVPKQPVIGAPQPYRAILKKANTLPRMDGPPEQHERNNPPLSPESDEVNKIKTGHVLTELLETERQYVCELLAIINGYKKQAKSPEMQHLVPEGYAEKFEVIFGNLEDIYTFHSGLFLKDIETCISSTDLVGLCFFQKRERFFSLYSFYCQNISRSEQVRENSVELQPFFQACQKKLGHKLPLAAYLLKPVQRITKYQLLIKDLLKYSDDKKCGRELQKALDCMLLVLKCVNDSMHQISITGFPLDLSQQGELLLQGSFSVWVDNKKEVRLRLKPMRRHLFLYQKALLFCKTENKTVHNKATYQFKHYLKMSQIGLTESVKGDPKKFEVWLQGRQEVHIIQASSVDQKQAWVNEIKGVLFNQLEELKGEKIKQYGALQHRKLTQTTSWEKRRNDISNPSLIENQRTVSCDMEGSQQQGSEEEENETGNWSSDWSVSDEDDHEGGAVPNGRYVTLADYCAVGTSEVSMKEGDIVELLKVGCAGWWFVKVVGSSVEGWAPASYLDSVNRKTSRSTTRSHDKLNDH